MSRIKDTDFAYSDAKVRAAETRLLDRVKLQRMTEAENLGEAVKILKESGYEGDNAEEMLRAELAKTYAFLREISPYKDAFDIFLVKNDYHNIRVLLKAEFLGKNFDFLLTEGGRYPAQLMKTIVETRAVGKMSERMREAFSLAVEIFEKTGDPQLCELELDRAAYDEMGIMAQKTQNDYIADIVATMCDLYNIRAFARTKKMGKGADFLLKALAQGGKIKAEAFVRDKTASLSEILKGTAYEALTEFSDDIAELEKQADNFMSHYIKKAKYITFGIEPLVSYLIAKENEIKQVRIILTGKKNDLPSEIIRERLREAYV